MNPVSVGLGESEVSSVENISSSCGLAKTPVSLPPENRFMIGSDSMVPAIKTEDSKKINTRPKWPYVHKETRALITNMTQIARQDKACPSCQRDLNRCGNIILRHVWDHFLIYACECGEVADKYEAMHSHQRRHMPVPPAAYKICPRMFSKAKQELSAKLPDHFPDKPLKLPTKRRRGRARKQAIARTLHQSAPSTTSLVPNLMPNGAMHQFNLPIPEAKAEPSIESVHFSVDGVNPSVCVADLRMGQPSCEVSMPTVAETAETIARIRLNMVRAQSLRRLAQQLDEENLVLMSQLQSHS